jgi:hypothetical protein
MSIKMTYGELYDKLSDLGFTRRAVEIDGKRRYVFQHGKRSNAMIVLPERDLDDSVEPSDMGSVVANLRVHELLPAHDPLAS